jgi:Raf kinase inhibitor-like YbhB/YbcL family protein
LAFAGTLAAVNADTWATELGVLSRRSPRLISTGKVVERGASGGISLAGLLAALGGAVMIAGLAVLPLTADTGSAARAFIIGTVVALAGLAGSLVDSLLGSTLQVIYTCPTCAKETERHPTHTCGTTTVYQRGWRWLNNDWVNAACATAGAGLVLASAVLAPAASPLFTGLMGLAAPAKESVMATFPLSCPAFTQGSLIPKQFTCDGVNVSPALNWSGLPPGTLSLALITDDPDAPGGTFTHWVLYNISPSLTGLPEGVLKATQAPGIGTHGNNSFGRPGYGGPCPPRGAPHRYYFTLYALDLPPDLPPGLTSTRLQSAMHGHILAEGQWMGNYQR